VSEPARTSAQAPARGRLALAVAWLVLSLAGLVGTWAFNIAFMADPQGLGYLEGWFANPASSSAAVDIIVVALAACLFMLVEGARLGWARWVWVLVVLSFAVAVAFTFPLFLGLRELALRRGERSAEGSAVPAGA